MASKKTVIVTGASQGIGAAVVQAFLARGYNVVATSRSVSNAGFAPSPNLALVDGDIGQLATATRSFKVLSVVCRRSKLTATVSNVGGRGSFGAHGWSPPAVKDVITEIHALTPKPFAINLWVSMKMRVQALPVAKHLREAWPPPWSARSCRAKSTDFPPFAASSLGVDSSKGSTLWFGPPNCSDAGSAARR